MNTGEDDLPVVDLISKLRLDDFSYDFPGVKKVRGSNRIQTAYRLSRRADLSAPTKSLLPHGLPQQFSFVCSFRKRPSKNDAWSLVKVQDHDGQPQFDLTLHPQKQSLELIALGPDSRPRTLYFPGVDCDDGQWYKLHLGIFVDRVTLYLNCEKHSTLPIDFGNDINLKGSVQVAKYSDASNLGTVPVSYSRPTIQSFLFLLTQFVLPSCYFDKRSIFSGWYWDVMLRDPKGKRATSCRFVPHCSLLIIQKDKTLLSLKLQPRRPVPQVENPEPGIHYPSPTVVPAPIPFPAYTIPSTTTTTAATTALFQPSGPRGEKGEKGEKGLPGGTGPMGMPGLDGRAGDAGMSGVDGRDGTKGERGEKGDSGMS